MSVKPSSIGKGWRTAAMLGLLLVSFQAFADIMVRVEESFNGQLPITAVHWFGHERSTRDDGSRYVVTRLDEGRIYTVDRLAQNYSVTPLPELKSADAKPDVRALKRDETRTVGQWTAQKYEVIGAATAGMQIVIWATTEVDIDLENFRSIMTGLARRPGSEWMAAYREIDGFPVLQEVSLEHKGIQYFGQTRVVAVEEREPPAHIYSPPEEYEQLNATSAP